MRGRESQWVKLMSLDPKFRHVIITGASSGIGEALAYGYAQPEVVLGLTGRCRERLDKVAEKCRKKGAQVETALIDVTDQDAMAAWLRSRDAELPIDLVIANAGISGGTGGSKVGEDPVQARQLFDVNLTGVLNTVDPALPGMIERGRGHIALMSSLAGFRGWPGAPAYCASKAAVKIYGEGLRGALAGTGVNVSVICPGFVRSRMSDANDFPMPFMVETDRAACTIMRGIEKNRGRIAFPFPAHFLSWLFGTMPNGIAQGLLKNMPSKSALD